MWILLAACTCANRVPETQTVEPGPPALREVTTKFAGQLAAELAPERAFAVADRCPRLTRVTYTPSGKEYARAVVSGEHLERVVKVGGALPDGTLVELRFTQEEGGIGFPILAQDVEVVLGIKEGSGVAGCRGPGYSFSVEKGALVAR